VFRSKQPAAPTAGRIVGTAMKPTSNAGLTRSDPISAAAHIGTYGRPRTSGWIAHIAGHGRADLADVAHRLEVGGSTVWGTALETAATYVVTTDEIKEKA
jgi:hypothetical protein